MLTFKINENATKGRTGLLLTLFFGLAYTAGIANIYLAGGTYPGVEALVTFIARANWTLQVIFSGLYMFIALMFAFHKDDDPMFKRAQSHWAYLSSWSAVRVITQITTYLVMVLVALAGHEELAVYMVFLRLFTSLVIYSCRRKARGESDLS